MKIKTEIFSKIKKIKKLPVVLAKNVFMFFILLVLLSIILGGLLFYKYCFLVESSSPENFDKPVKLEENIIQEVFKKWDQQQERFDGAGTRQYPDLF